MSTVIHADPMHHSATPDPLVTALEEQASRIRALEGRVKEMEASIEKAEAWAARWHSAHPDGCGCAYRETDGWAEK